MANRRRRSTFRKTPLMRDIEDDFGRDLESLFVQLRYRQRRSIGEIAEIIAVSPGTVWLWMREMDMTLKQDAYKYRMGQTAAPLEDKPVVRLHNQEEGAS